MIAKRPTSTVRVGKKAQIVIPAALRKELGIEEGDVLRVDVDECKRLVLTVVPGDPVERLRRALAGAFEGIDPIQYQRESRAESEWRRNYLDS